MGKGGASRGAARFLMPLAVTLIAACDRPGETLASTAHARVDATGAQTLHVTADGRLWIGAPGVMVVLAADGTEEARVRVPSASVPEVAAESDSITYLRGGDQLYAMRGAAGELLADRPGFHRVPVISDSRSRFVMQGAASGAVLGFDPVTLEPVWGWAARGAPTTALAATPEGDVVWQALAPAGTRGLLLERDLQTGRILDEHRLSGRLVSLRATPSGDLLVLVTDGDRLRALRLQPRGDLLTVVWDTSIDLDGDQNPVARYAPASDRIAIFRPGDEAGLRVLDAEAGDLIGSVTETPLDAAFSANGSLYLLTSSEVRIVPGIR